MKYTYVNVNIRTDRIQSESFFIYKDTYIIEIKLKT